MTPDNFLANLPTRANIIQRMTEPHRIYHNLNHAMEIAWNCFKPLYNNQLDEDFFYLAAFYHDIIYVPGAKDNELLSAFEFQKDLQNLKIKSFDDFDIAKDVNTAILLSTDHFSEKALKETQGRVGVFLDLDLCRQNRSPIQSFCRRIFGWWLYSGMTSRLI